MNWLDIALAIILAWNVVAAFRRGFTREIFGLASVILGFLLAVWFYGSAGSLLAPYLSSRWLANLLGFFTVFCGIWILGALCGRLLGKFWKVTGLTIVDHLLGALFGGLRGVLICLVIVMAITAFSQGDKPPAAIVNSRIAPHVMDAAGMLTPLAPREVKDGFARTYRQVLAAWGKAFGKPAESAPGATKG